MEEITLVVLERFEYKDLDFLTIFFAFSSGQQSDGTTLYALKIQCQACGNSFPENIHFVLSPFKKRRCFKDFFSENNCRTFWVQVKHSVCHIGLLSLWHYQIGFICCPCLLGKSLMIHKTVKWSKRLEMENCFSVCHLKNFVTQNYWANILNFLGIIKKMIVYESNYHGQWKLRLYCKCQF